MYFSQNICGVKLGNIGVNWSDKGVKLAVGHTIGGVITADLNSLSLQSRSQGHD